MIQLATEPTASRTGYRPSQRQDETKEATLESRGGRIGHPWPFLSRYVPRPVSRNLPHEAGGGPGSS